MPVVPCAPPLAGALAQLTDALKPLLGASMRVRRQAACAIGQVVKASPEMAIAVAQSSTLAEVVRCALQASVPAAPVQKGAVAALIYKKRAA